MKKDEASDQSQWGQSRSCLLQTRWRVGSYCLLALLAFSVHAQPLTFTTFAGPVGGAGWADGTGGAARFSNPRGVATDAAGNLYVADVFNATIRKITPAGVVTTLAGLAGVFGSTDGTGSTARFHFPCGVATDRDGNVYVTDSDRVRKITPAGMVTTLAGFADKGSVDGTGSAARFASPWGIATDRDGNVYVADNATIRKVTPAGMVTTLAGLPDHAGSADGTGSAARFGRPAGVATDVDGNVYVSDMGGRTIRRIASGGVVTTLAGLALAYGDADGTGSAARFQSPNGIAIDRAGNLYVADKANDTIRKVTMAGVVTTLAGSWRDAGDGTGGIPGVATDGAGNVYVSDSLNMTIRKITPAGVQTILAGAPGPSGMADGTRNAARFKDPAGVAIDGAGNVYVAEPRASRIRKITPAGIVTTLVATDAAGNAARFEAPWGVATDTSGNVYVADSGNKAIRKITPAGVGTTLAGSTGTRGSENGAREDARFAAPSGIACDHAGNVYVGDTGNHTIRRITPGGVVTTLAGSAGLEGQTDGAGKDARFKTPMGVAVDAGGNVYVADSDNFTIRKITPAGVVTTLAGAAGRSGFAEGTGSAAHFYRPKGVATDSGGNVYVTDQGKQSIRKITPAGVVTTLAGSAENLSSEDGTGGAARFYNPAGIACDGAGNIYIADETNHKIRIGRPGLADTAAIDSSTGAVGEPRQLGTSSRTATSWQWTLIRQPAASAARLSSTSIANPRFTPDVPDLYIFQLTATDGKKTSITTVSLTATAPGKP